MNNDTKEFYMIKAKEYETEAHYLAEILNRIIAESGYRDVTINALARAGYDAYRNKRKSLTVEGNEI